jgi:hypothetical protein
VLAPAVETDGAAGGFFLLGNAASPELLKNDQTGETKLLTLFGTASNSRGYRQLVAVHSG